MFDVHRVRPRAGAQEVPEYDPRGSKIWGSSTARMHRKYHCMRITSNGVLILANSRLNCRKPIEKIFLTSNSGSIMNIEFEAVRVLNLSSPSGLWYVSQTRFMNKVASPHLAEHYPWRPRRASHHRPADICPFSSSRRAFQPQDETHEGSAGVSQCPSSILIWSRLWLRSWLLPLHPSSVHVSMPMCRRRTAVPCPECSSAGHEWV